MERAKQKSAEELADIWDDYHLGRGHVAASMKASFNHYFVIPLWKGSGYTTMFVQGSFPGRQALENIVFTWGVKCRIFPYGKGWTVFRFMNDADRLKTLYGGPYIAYGKTLMLKTIEEGTILTDDLFTKIPTWVLLHDVPLSVWSESGLSKLSSKIGTPLYTDKVTKERSKMNYARCLIEVDVNRSPLLEFPVTMSKGRKYVQKVSYEHYPDFCCECKKFGHNVFNCPKTASSKAAGPIQKTAMLPPLAKNNVTSNGKAPSLITKSNKGKAPIKEPNALFADTNQFMVLTNVGETSSTCETNIVVPIKENMEAANAKGAEDHIATKDGCLHLTTNDETMIETTVFVVPEAITSHEAEGTAGPIQRDETGWKRVGESPKKKGRGRAKPSFVTKR